MAVTVQNSGNPFTGQNASNAVATVTAAVTVAAGTNTAMLICVQGEGQGLENDRNITQMSVNGNTGIATLLKREYPVGGFWSWTEIWGVDPADLPDGSYNVIATANGGDLMTIQVYVADGVDTTTPFSTPQSQNSGGSVGTTSNASLLDTELGDYIIDSLCIDATGHSPSASGSGTVYFLNNTGHTGCTQGYTAVGSGDSLGWTWTTNAPFSYIAVAFKQYVIPPQQLRPDADTTTPAGWATTPLWSKVDEASAGGDVIVGTFAASGTFGPSPMIAGQTEGALSSAGTSLAITLPSGGASTDLYMVIVAKGATACTINALANWTEITDDNVATGHAIIIYTGTGVPSNPTFTQSASTRSAWVAYRITGADKTITPQIGTVATGSSTTPDPPSVTVTGGPKNVLGIAFFSRGGEIADTDTLVSAFPSGYTDGQAQKSAGTVGSNLAGIIGSAAQRITNTSTVNPGTFTASTGAWRAQTIVVHPAPSTATPVAEISLAAGSTPSSQTQHKLKVRARVVSGTANLMIALYEGANNRSGNLTQGLSPSFTDFTINISDANAANITSYANLGVRFWGDSADGSAGNLEIDQIWLEIPESAGAAPTQVPLAGGITLGAAMTLVKKAPRLMAVTETMTLTMAPVKRAPRALAATETMGISMLNPKKAAVNVALFEFLTAAMTPIKKKPVALAANLTLTPAMTLLMKYIRLLAVTLTLSPTMVRVLKAPRAVAATLTLSPAMTRIMTAPRAMPVTLTLTGALTAVKKYGRAISAALTFTATMVPKQLKIQSLPVGLTLTPVMSRIVTAPRLLAATATMTISVVKKNPRTLAVTETYTVVMNRIVTAPRLLVATLTLTAANSLRQIRPKALAANLTLTPTMQRIKLNLISFPVGMTLTAAMTSLKKTGRNLAANLTLTPTMARVVKAPRLLAASLTLTPAMIRKFNLLITLNATLTAAVAMVKKYPRAIAANLTLTPTMGNKQLQLRALAANLTLTAALTRVKKAPRLLAASETLTAALSKRPRLIRNVNLNLTAGSTMKSTYKLNLPVGLTMTPEMVRRFFVKFAAVLPFTVDMTNTEGFTTISFNVTLNLVAKMNAFRATLGRVWLYAASTPSRIWGALTRPKLIDTAETNSRLIDADSTKPKLHDVE